MYHLGVPTGAGDHMFVVRDEHHQTAIQKLKDSGFTQAPPDRRAAPEIMEFLPDPQAVFDEINKGYERLDRYCTSFQFPPRLPFSGDQIFLIPNSFAHLPLDNLGIPSNLSSQMAQPKQYEVYGNLFYPLEAALVESFVKGVVHDIEEVGYSSWQLLLNAWISMMRGYLEVNDDILDNCADERTAQYGGWDLRVSKRLGSGKEMPVDMRGNTIS
ncbi:hypothetical protein BDV06DRAFT_212144 [Aspergillus oleicola]